MVVGVSRHCGGRITECVSNKHVGFIGHQTPIVIQIDEGEQMIDCRVAQFIAFAQTVVLRTLWERWTSRWDSGVIWERGRALTSMANVQLTMSSGRAKNCIGTHAIRTYYMKNTL